MTDGGLTQEVILLRETLPEGGWVGVFWNIYVDESGDEGTEMFALGGYLIEARRAMLMQGHWRKLLAEHNLPFFHMTDAAAHTDQHPNKLFAHMSAKEVDTLARKLMDLIKKYAQFGAVALINPQRANGLKNNYAALMWMLLSRFRGKVRQIEGNVDPAFSIFLEAGHASRSVAEASLVDAVRTHKGPNPPAVSFARKGQVTLLQAADIISWQVTKRHKDMCSQNKRDRERGARADFRELMKVETNFLFYSIDATGTQNFYNKNVTHRPSTRAGFDELEQGYLRALFGFGDDAEKVMAEFHEFFDRETGKPLVESWDKLDDPDMA